MRIMDSFYFNQFIDGCLHYILRLDIIYHNVIDTGIIIQIHILRLIMILILILKILIISYIFCVPNAGEIATIIHQ